MDKDCMGAAFIFGTALPGPAPAAILSNGPGSACALARGCPGGGCWVSGGPLPIPPLYPPGVEQRLLQVVGSHEESREVDDLLHLAHRCSPRSAIAFDRVPDDPKKRLR